MDERDFGRAIALLDNFLAEDSTHVEGRFLRAIALRERGRNPTLKTYLRRLRQRSALDFEYVLQQDSSYRDVLYQYAILRRYSRDLEGAIELGEAQLRMRSDLDHVLPGVLAFYWRFVVEREPESARIWLRRHGGSLAPLFLARAYERQGMHDAAEQLYTSVEPTVPALVALGRLQFARGQPEAGTRAIEAAVASIASRVDALVLFEEIKTVASPEEVAEFRRLTDVAAYQEFFQVFWTRRDPMPAAPYNARIAEHYRRLRVAEQHFLFYGYRTWYRSVFTHDAGYFPETYALGHDFDDRGIVYIRHGEPDDRTIGDANSWLYRDSLLVFHFAPTCTAGICSVTAHFVPSPKGPTFSPSVVGLDALDAERKSSGYLVDGLSSDRHSWPEHTRHWDVPYVIAAYRGLDDHSLVEIHYRVPLPATARGRGPDSIQVEAGFVIHDEQWQRLSYVRDQRTRLRGGAAYVDRFQVDLVPATYHVSIHARVLDGVHLAAHQQTYTPARFDRPGLKISDVLLADSVHVLSDVQSREDARVYVNPSGAFERASAPHVYFEIYDLGMAPDAQTRYRVSYTLVPDRDGREGAITLQTDEQRSVGASPLSYVALDLAQVPRGDYTLEVVVEDLISHATAQRTRALEVR